MPFPFRLTQTSCLESENSQISITFAEAVVQAVRKTPNGDFLPLFTYRCNWVLASGNSRFESWFAVCSP
ncbi:predicted protein [Botrytis cinerea T4]|uniref:Uncharacterized protein n=1 Tax=Botryotinia fuckeliana (strain T4) TaxID=999810 RepID=G2YMX2_BOTF4|nr:predicted protein [Botrytis cinerea T4]